MRFLYDLPPAMVVFRARHMYNNCIITVRLALGFLKMVRNSPEPSELVVRRSYTLYTCTHISIIERVNTDIYMDVEKEVKKYNKTIV